MKQGVAVDNEESANLRNNPKEAYVLQQESLEDTDRLSRDVERVCKWLYKADGAARVDNVGVAPPNVDWEMLTKLRREGGNDETTNEYFIQLSESQAVDFRGVNSGYVGDTDNISTIMALI